MLDQGTREVRRGGELIELTPKEFAVLEYLMRHAGRVMSRTLITEYAWGYHFDPGTNIVDVVINHLRKKIDAQHEQEADHDRARGRLHDPRLARRGRARAVDPCAADVGLRGRHDGNAGGVLARAPHGASYCAIRRVGGAGGARGGAGREGRRTRRDRAAWSP